MFKCVWVSVGFCVGYVCVLVCLVVFVCGSIGVCVNVRVCGCIWACLSHVVVSEHV